MTIIFYYHVHVCTTHVHTILSILQQNYLKVHANDAATNDHSWIKDCSMDSHHRISTAATLNSLEHLPYYCLLNQFVFANHVQSHSVLFWILNVHRVLLLAHARVVTVVVPGILWPTLDLISKNLFPLLVEVHSMCVPTKNKKEKTKKKKQKRKTKKS